MLCKNILACNMTSTLLSPCHIPQACIPLSYAAQIPTTGDPDLANVRVSLLNLHQNVRQCSAHFFFMRVCLTANVWERKVYCVRFFV